MPLPKTIICDIDGCIFEHEGKGASHQWTNPHILLPGVEFRFNGWEKRGYYIILITARKESCRDYLESELIKHNLFWDLLIMGVPHGERILINDEKSNENESSAKAIVIERNAGL